MSVRRRPRQREAQLAFEAISIEGGLLSPDWLSRVGQLSAGAQTEADYRVPKGLNLRDEIGRYWRIAQAHWREFESGRFAGADAGALAERFVQALLHDTFGFDSLALTEPVVVADRMYPIGFSALGRRVPLVVAPAGSGVDTLASSFGDGGRRRSAFGLAQEFLNAADGATWGLVSDGLTLRVVRDNASLTRPAWIEADLGRIFTEGRYADFAALWLLAHETRFGKSGQPGAECALDIWRTAGREEGTRAREHLRKSVEDAVVSLGQGFLSYPDNGSLRAALQDGSLTKTAYFQQLLRLVYRLIFLLTVEERGLLHPDTSPEAARHLYAEGYSLQRLRERSVKRSAHDRFSDLWEAMKIVFRGVGSGEPRLALPALAGLFASTQCPALDAAKVENQALLLAVFRLSWLREASGLSRVNWRDMGPEELGSVYESLLELQPQITHGGRAFGFATGGEAKGHARKTTGSYYTPDSLVQVLLDSALEPVVQSTIAAHPEDSVQALLDLSIVDPACGSGHFLLAAARRLAAHVARIQANGTPSAAEYRHALRQVVGRCIYGVDLNPMAVELCKVSLWMEAVEPGLPLTFLNSHIQHGNALLGTTPELMAKGVPDAAWEPIEGDDKKIASALKKRSKKAEAGQRGLSSVWSEPGENESTTVARAVAELEAAPDADAGALARKESQWEAILESEAYRHQRFVADAWCAAFVWPKQSGTLDDAAPTNELWRQIRDGQGRPPALTVETTSELATQYDFFHWHLAFPQVFARGGFDIVMGNPPWERVKLQEREWFAERRPDIADAPNAAARKQMIRTLQDDDAGLIKAFLIASRRAEAEGHFLRASGAFPLCGRGDINRYAVFAEKMSALRSNSGRAGFIVPSGIATDDSTKEYFAEMMSSRRLVSVFDFENRENLFPGIGHGRMKFSLFTVGRAESSVFAFQLWNVAQLQHPGRLFELTNDDVALLNPNTRTCPIFRTRREADITMQIYRRVPVFAREGIEPENAWSVAFHRMFDMASDSGMFKDASALTRTGARRSGNRYVHGADRYLPLYEAKMASCFDHRFGTFEGRHEDRESSALDTPTDLQHADATFAVLPRYWVAEGDVPAGQWLLTFRLISHATNDRTCVAQVLPRAGLGHSLAYLTTGARESEPLLYANLCSLAFDFVVRQKLGGLNLSYFIVKQLPVLSPGGYSKCVPWAGGEIRTWLLPRVLELTYTSWDLEPFARDVGYDGPPFRWDSSRRFLLRAELDAVFFHLYDLSRDDTAYVLDTFPIVRKNDEKAYGEYCTKRVILEIYDAMAEAARTEQPYVTRLDPPPADRRVAHPPRAAEC